MLHLNLISIPTCFDRGILRDFTPINDINMSPAYISGVKINLTLDKSFRLQIRSPKSRKYQFHFPKPDLVTFTEESLNRKLLFLCSVI